MPPSKRAKKAAVRAVPSSPISEDADADLDSKDVNEPGPSDENAGEDEYTLDPALLDEEETPGGSDSNVLTEPASYAAGGYNALKTFKGQIYSGMAVGGSHTWNYDQGEWKETKEEPDRWKIDYKTAKRRVRKAPKGSGAPVGTGYHWLIVAHQVSLLLEYRLS